LPAPPGSQDATPTHLCAPADSHSRGFRPRVSLRAICNNPRQLWGKFDFPRVRVDPEKVEVEHRVQIGSEQKAVLDAILSICRTRYYVSGFKSLLGSAVRKHALALLCLYERIAKLRLPSPVQNTSHYAFALSSPCQLWDSTGPLLAFRHVQ
jgi:hypothetical protein